MRIALSEKIFFFMLLAVTVFVLLAILYPFLTILVLAAAFTVVLDPIYQWIKRYMAFGVASIASLITVALFVVVLCAPVYFIGSAVLTQMQSAYNSLVATNNHQVFLQSLDVSINKLLPQGISVDLGSKVADGISFISGHLAGFFTSIFQTIAMFMFMILAIFYMLKDGKSWKDGFALLCPISKSNIDEIFSKLHSTINQIIKGTFLVAIIQGVLAGIGFTIFGVPNAILWAVASSIASLVPTVGTSLVFIPAVLFLYFTGLHMQALGLLIWSFAFVALVDDFLSPFIISKKSEMPSMFVLFSILGGISLMGPVGIVIGPLVLSLLYSLISIYKKEAGLN